MIAGEVSTNTVFTRRGMRNFYIGTSYEDSPISIEAEIVTEDAAPLSNANVRAVQKWLFNQPNYRKLYIHPDCDEPDGGIDVNWDGDITGRERAIPVSGFCKISNNYIDVYDVIGGTYTYRIDSGSGGIYDSTDEITEDTIIALDGNIEHGYMVGDYLFFVINEAGLEYDEFIFRSPGIYCLYDKSSDDTYVYAKSISKEGGANVVWDGNIIGKEFASFTSEDSSGFCKISNDVISQNDIIGANVTYRQVYGESSYDETVNITSEYISLLDGESDAGYSVMGLFVVVNSAGARYADQYILPSPGIYSMYQIVYESDALFHLYTNNIHKEASTDPQLYFNTRFINAEKIEGNGGVVGFKCTMECDSLMMWQDAYTESFELSLGEGGNTNIHLNIDTDLKDFTYPKVTIEMGSSGGSVQLVNYSDDESRITKFVDIPAETVLYINGMTNYVSGTYYDYFNGNFVRLLDGSNTIGVIGAVEKITFEWQNRRYL